MNLEITLQQVPNQTLTTTINNIPYRLQLNTRLGELYLSVIKDGKPIVYNRICLNKTLIADNFLFVDMNANANPVFNELNDRFKLLWTDELL